MTITLKPEAVRAGWHHGANARAEVREALGRTAEAAGTDLADLAATLSDAADGLDGVLRVVLGVVAEHHLDTERSIADFEATDGAAAGEFRGLAR